MTRFPSGWIALLVWLAPLLTTGTVAALPPADHPDADWIRRMLNPETCPPVMRVTTARDTLPGGLSAAMCPMVVHWGESDDRADAVIHLANVNHGTNPFSGTTELRRAWVKPDKIKRVDYVVVPLGGPGVVISHAQLRFVFEPDGAGFVDESEPLSELVLSWEAWRKPGVDFSAKRGLDAGQFTLSLRAYSAPQRFLEDALNRRDWIVYQLDLPGGRAGAEELFRVAVILGDGAARHALLNSLGEPENAWVGRESAPAFVEWEKNLAERTDADPRLDMEGKTGYQSAIRSCASMALYSVNVAVERRLEVDRTTRNKRTVPAPDIVKAPDWMKKLSKSNWVGVFVRVPEVVEWVWSNQTAVPGNIPDELNKAGLLVTRNGQPIKTTYTSHGQTPWGPSTDVLIR